MSASDGSGGAARALPAHRLRDFEQDETADLTDLLPPRRSRTQPAQPGTPPEDDDATPPVAGEPPSTTTPGAPLPSDAPPAGGGRATTDQAPAALTQDAAALGGPYNRKNKIRPSVVHIPTRVKDKLLADREQTRRSNGDIIIAAIEHAHPRLHELLGGRSSPTGGTVFAARASRVPRVSQGDLTPLNVRLYEADWEVIDGLVAEHGAASRGHLISTALLDLYQLPPRAETR